LPEANVRRFRNRMRGLRDSFRAGAIPLQDVTQRVRSWIAHAAHADTWRLRQAIFRGGRFTSPRRPDRPHQQARSSRRLVQQQTGQYAFGQPQQEQP